MPYLALDTTADLTATDRRDCTNAFTELYTDIVETESDHVAINVRDHPTDAMALGRAVDGPIAASDWLSLTGSTRDGESPART